MKWTNLGSACLSLTMIASCGQPAQTGNTLRIEGVVSTDGHFATNLQTALIEAAPGSTIRLPEGHFQLETGLSLDVDGVTLTGAGADKTILDFAKQTWAGEGLLVTSDDVILADFSIRDTKGDGIKSKGADRITYRDLIVEWSGEPDETNGAYGVYPVESHDVLIERVVVRGASDAGIYVGQSNNIIVRNSVAEYNVAGIEIENSMHADVYGNIAQHNTGGILVFDLPDLPQTGGHSTRVFDNQIIDNNTRNFAPAGNIVASVPSGTGVIVMANRNVHVFSNTFSNNRSAHVLLTAYAEPFSDTAYNPVPRDIVLSGNSYTGGGEDPQGMLAPIAGAIGGTLPEIVVDGVAAWDGGSIPTTNISIQEDEAVGFLDLGIGKYPLDPSKIAPTTQRPSAVPVGQPDPVSLPQDKS
jgi:parallel beta-helix repeat protein